MDLVKLNLSTFCRDIELIPTLTVSEGMVFLFSGSECRQQDNLNVIVTSKKWTVNRDPE